MVDWTGLAPQVKGAINNTLSFTKSATYCAIRSILPQNIPNNEGVFRAIEVDGAAGHRRQRRAAGGLRGARADRVSHGRLHVRGAGEDAARPGVRRRPTAAIPAISIGGYDADRSPFIYVDFTCCAWGGRPYADGLDGNSNIYANMASQPIEVTESRAAARRSPPTSSSTTRWGRANSAAARRSAATISLLAEEAILQVRSDRRDFRPYGLYGGGPGKPSMNYLNPDARTRPAAVEADDEHPAGATCSATRSPAPAAGAIRWSATRRWC